MPSEAYADHLLVLLDDADELAAAHQQLRTGNPGRQWGLGSINRAVVVMCVSAWEAYIESVLLESISAIRPLGPNRGVWPSQNASTRSLIGRFNNPNVDQVRVIIADSIGLQDITDSWYWANCSPQHAKDFLTEALRNRHQIAHGVNPRPIIHNQYARWLPVFFRRLGVRTDQAIRTYLIDTLGVANPWPP